MAVKTPKPAKYTDDEEIVKEAHERFQRCVDWESLFRARYLEDIRFANGDPDNGFQWPTETRKNRDVEKRPVLTVNKTRQYCLNIINDAKQNKPSVKVRPAGGSASFDGAQVMEGLIRHIEYTSNAQAVYDQATTTQVQGGVGYWRVLTEYEAENSFNQRLVIKGIKDPMMVYLDPDALEPDRRDMQYAFVFEDVPTDRFMQEHPNWHSAVGSSSLDIPMTWHDKNHTKVAEYFRIYRRKRKLYRIKSDDGSDDRVFNSDGLSPALKKQLEADPKTEVREVEAKEVQWFKIAGDVVVEKGTWAGSTIPVVQIIGEETVIEGQMDRKGHTRALKDPQRIYNYWTSSAVEFVALQSKAPFIGAAAAIEGYETYWREANLLNHSMLPYNHLDDQGNALQAPQRVSPPVMAPAYLQGMKVAADELRMASGQYQEDLGEQSNAVSGRAINARQREGDIATYHYIDNLGVGLRYTGAILIEMIPRVYDTRRVVQILAQDGSPVEVTLDPSAATEFKRQEIINQTKAQIIFNPNFSKYAVEADVGPAYATRRQEAFNAFTQIIAQSPDLMKVAGDLMFRAADFPMADELAERLKKLVPPFVLGKAPDPQTQQLLQNNQQLQEALQQMSQQYAKEHQEREGEQHSSAIDAFKAETDRLKVLVERLDPQSIALLAAQAVLQGLQTPLPQPLPAAPPGPAPMPAPGARILRNAGQPPAAPGGAPQ